MQMSKVVNHLCVFEPETDGSYSVYPEGREISYKGTKEAILKKMTKKYPTLKNPMAFLIDQEVTFFYDAYFQEFRTTKKGLSKENRNKGIQLHLANVAYYIASNKKMNEFKNPYVSSVGFNNWNFIENKDKVQDFNVETEKEMLDSVVEIKD